MGIRAGGPSRTVGKPVHTGRLGAREVVAGAAIGAAAFVASGGVAAVGLALVGVDAAQAVAVVASAVGTPVTMVPDLPRAGTVASVDVRLHVVATGVALVGVLALALGFRRVPGVGALVGAVAAFAGLLGVTALLTGGGATGLSADPLTAVLLAVVGVVVVWALGLVPAVLRPALSATVLVLGFAALLATAGGAVATGFLDARLVGAVLLAGPSALFAAITAGLGVSWSVDADEQVTRLLGGVLPDVPTVDVPMWPLTVLAVGLLLVCGVLTAARTRGAADVTDLVLRCAATLGAVFAAASAGMVLVASARVGVRVSARGFVFLDTAAGVGGSVWTAVALGLVAGALAGAVGALLFVAVRRADGPYPGRTTAGGGYATGSAAGGRGRSDAAGTPRGEPAVRGVRGRDGGRRGGGAGTGRP
jgi:hypothetical protein